MSTGVQIIVVGGGIAIVCLMLVGIFALIMTIWGD